MNVFIAGTSFRLDYGGPAVSVSHLAGALADAGVRVGLWAPDGSATASDVVPRARDNLIRLAGSLEAALERFGPPVVFHDNGLWLPHNHRIATLTHQRGIARIVSVRGMLQPWAIRHKRIKKAIAWHLYQRRDLRMATLLHATADLEIDAVRALGVTTPIVKIANGVDLPVHSCESVRPTQQENGRIALFLSRINPKKGLPMLLEAWARLRPSGWRLLIAGPDEGGHRAEVEALVVRHRLTGDVSFLGPVKGEAKTSAYRTADLFLLPTYSENFGMVVTEALSYGVPVLTTRGAPWRELETERCGWWVEPTVDGILTGLTEATAATSETLVKMGRRGRSLVAARYGWQSIAQQFLATYARVISDADLSERSFG